MLPAIYWITCIQQNDLLRLADSHLSDNENLSNEREPPHPPLPRHAGRDFGSEFFLPQAEFLSPCGL